MFLGIIGISSADEQCSEARFKCIKKSDGIPITPIAVTRSGLVS